MRTLGIASLLLLHWVLAVPESLPAQARSNQSQELLREAQLLDARSSGGLGFRLEAKITLENGGKMEAIGSYALLWASPVQWREEFLLPDFHQIRLGGAGGIWETRTPPYLSLRLWQLMQALSFYGRLTLPQEDAAAKIKLRNKDGKKLRCIEIMRYGYISPLREICFGKDSTELVSEHYYPSDRTYQFSNYVHIGSKAFPKNVEAFDGKTLAASFYVTHLEPVNDWAPSSFDRQSTAAWRAWCPSPEKGGDPVTPIYSLDLKTKGKAIIYAAIGPDGLTRDLHILESGGPDHDSAVLEALRKERWQPSTCSGVHIKVETVFSR